MDLMVLSAIYFIVPLTILVIVMLALSLKLWKPMIRAFVTSLGLTLILSLPVLTNTIPIDSGRSVYTVLLIASALITLVVGNEAFKPQLKPWYKSTSSHLKSFSTKGLHLSSK